MPVCKMKNSNLEEWLFTRWFFSLIFFLSLSLAVFCFKFDFNDVYSTIIMAGFGSMCIGHILSCILSFVEKWEKTATTTTTHLIPEQKRQNLCLASFIEYPNKQTTFINIFVSVFFSPFLFVPLLYFKCWFL